MIVLTDDEFFDLHHDLVRVVYVHLIKQFGDQDFGDVPVEAVEAVVCEFMERGWIKLRDDGEYG